MNFQYNFRMSFLIIIGFLEIFLVFSISKNIYAEDDFSKTLSNSSNQNIDNSKFENNNIPNQYIVYLQEDNKKEIDPLEFYNSELKNSGTELLQVYNHVVKGLAIKVPNEKVLEDLKSNPLVEYIGQDKKVSAFTESPMEIQIIPGNRDKE
jgi:Peptidase inhibitor I9